MALVNTSARISAEIKTLKKIIDSKNNQLDRHVKNILGYTILNYHLTIPLPGAQMHINIRKACLLLMENKIKKRAYSSVSTPSSNTI
jgi:hypothetical protein